MTGRQSARREASELLARTLELVQEFVGSLPERHVGATADAGQLIEALGGRMPEEGVPARQVIKDLARDADAGLVASAGPRYFGFVVGAACIARRGLAHCRVGPERGTPPTVPRRGGR